MLKSHLSQLYQLSESQRQQQQEHPFQDARFDAIAEEEEAATAEADATPSDPISSMCQQLSQELSALSSKEDEQVIKIKGTPIETATQL